MSAKSVEPCPHLSDDDIRALVHHDHGRARYLALEVLWLRSQLDKLQAFADRAAKDAKLAPGQDIPIVTVEYVEGEGYKLAGYDDSYTTQETVDVRAFLGGFAGEVEG